MTQGFVGRRIDHVGDAGIGAGEHQLAVGRELQMAAALAGRDRALDRQRGEVDHRQRVVLLAGYVDRALRADLSGKREQDGGGDDEKEARHFSEVHEVLLMKPASSVGSPSSCVTWAGVPSAISSPLCNTSTRSAAAA